MHELCYCLTESRGWGLQYLVAATYFCLPLSREGRRTSLSLGFKTEAPACGRLKKDLWWQGKAVCSVEQRRGEEKRGEESLAAWIAWTALSGFMTPAV